MRLNEIISMIFNIGLIIEVVDVFLIADMFTHEKRKHLYPICASDQKLFFEWAGNAKSWFNIEIIVFINFVVTMIILMVKSRLTKVGMD